MHQDGPEGPRRTFPTCFHVPERHQDADHTCFYVSERPKESPGGRPIRVLPCSPDVWPASYVFLCVGGSFTSPGAAWRRLAPFGATVISCMLVAFCHDHT